MNHRLRSMIAALGVARILLLIVTAFLVWPNTGSEDLPQVGDSIEDRLNDVITRVEAYRITQPLSMDEHEGTHERLPSYVGPPVENGSRG